MAISFDRVADQYDASRGGVARGVAMAGTIRPWLPGPTALEVCVGTGIVAAALAAGGHTVFGVDISPRMAGRAYERLGARVVLGDARYLPIADSSVDAVVFVAALHLIGDIRAAFAEAARVLRPGGRLVAVHTAPTVDDTELERAVGPLREIRDRRPDHDEDLDAAAAATSLTLVHRGYTEPTQHAWSPRQYADGIENRLWSYLWPLDEDEWQRFAVGAIEGVRRLPDQDRPRPTVHRHRLTVLAHTPSAGAG